MSLDLCKALCSSHTLCTETCAVLVAQNCGVNHTGCGYLCCVNLWILYNTVNVWHCIVFRSPVSKYRARKAFELHWIGCWTNRPRISRCSAVPRKLEIEFRNSLTLSHCKRGNNPLELRTTGDRWKVLCLMRTRRGESNAESNFEILKLFRLRLKGALVRAPWCPFRFHRRVKIGLIFSTASASSVIHPHQNPSVANFWFFGAARVGGEAGHSGEITESPGCNAC